MKNSSQPMDQDILQQIVSSSEQDQPYSRPQQKQSVVNMRQTVNYLEEDLFRSQRQTAINISDKYTYNHLKSPSKLKKPEPIQQQTQENIDDQQKIDRIKQSNIKFSYQGSQNDQEQDQKGVRDSNSSFSDINFSSNGNLHVSNNSPIDIRVSKDSSNELRYSNASFSDFQSQQIDINQFSFEKPFNKREIEKQKYHVNITKVQKQPKSNIPKDMFTRKIQQLSSQKSNDSVSSNIKEKSTIRKFELPKQNDELGQSLYMMPVQPPKPHKPQKLDMAKQTKKNSQEVELFEVAGDYIFKTNKAERKININLFRYIEKQLLNSKNKIIIPLIDQQVLHSKYIFYFLNIFTTFMNSKYREMFFTIINQSKPTDQTQKQKEKNFLSFLSFDFMKQHKIWKAGKIKNILQSKLEAYYEIQSYNRQIISTEIRNLSETLAKLDFLLAFQRSQQYCQQKLKNVNSIQQPIWRDFRSQIVNDRNWWITNNFAQINL